jgi:hypothetical protein
LRFVPPLANELNCLDVADLAFRDKKFTESAFYDGLGGFELDGCLDKLESAARDEPVTLGSQLSRHGKNSPPAAIPNHRPVQQPVQLLPEQHRTALSVDAEYPCLQ